MFVCSLPPSSYQRPSPHVFACERAHSTTTTGTPRLKCRVYQASVTGRLFICSSFVGTSGRLPRQGRRGVEGSVPRSHPNTVADALPTLPSILQSNHSPIVHHVNLHVPASSRTTVGNRGKVGGGILRPGWCTSSCSSLFLPPEVFLPAGVLLCRMNVASPDCG